MKKLITIALLITMSFTLVACSNDTGNNIHETQSSTPTSQQTSASTVITTAPPLPPRQLPHIASFEDTGMPEPFKETLEGGGNALINPFIVPVWRDSHVYAGRCIASIDGSIVTPFITEDVFFEWADSWEMHYRQFEEPVTRLSDFHNIFSFIEAFDIPADEVAKILRELRVAREEWLPLGASSGFTDEELSLIVSLDEAAIMEHFVSDYAIYLDGAIFTPMWLYWHSPEDYAKVGITPEMVAERLPLYAKFEFAAEADVAFSEKLSEFVGEEISLSAMRAEYATS
jgi:hypothetical protein